MKKVLPIKSGAGFTLIEMIMVLFFAGILIVVIFNLYEWHNKYYNYQQGLVRVSSSSRGSAQTIQSYVTQASNVLSSASVNGTTYTSSSTALVLRLPSIDSSGNVISSKYDTAVFYVNGPNFYLKLQPDASSSRVKLNKLLSDTTQSVSFTYNNATYSLVTEVTVNFSTQLQVKDQIVKSNLQQDMYLLNFQ